jgi:hypothetical protein
MEDSIWESYEYEDNLDYPWQAESEPGYKKLSKVNVEDCYQLSAGNFGRGVLKPQGTSISDLADTTIGKSGITHAWNKWNALPIEFEITLGEQPKVFIQYRTKNSQRSQEINFITKTVTFGEKPFLQCFQCGYTGKIYLRPRANFWYCRRCCNLVYELQRINKRSVMGLLAYCLTRTFKIKDSNAMVRRIKYRGQYTRRARAVLRMAKKWRITPEIKARIGNANPQ